MNGRNNFSIPKAPEWCDLYNSSLIFAAYASASRKDDTIRTWMFAMCVFLPTNFGTISFSILAAPSGSVTNKIRNGLDARRTMLFRRGCISVTVSVSPCEGERVKESEVRIEKESEE